MKNKMIRIPFIFSEYEEFNGIDFNILYKDVKRDSAWLDITGLCRMIGGNSSRFSITALIEGIGGNYSGFGITGLGKIVNGNFDGFDLNGFGKIVEGTSRGVAITGVINYSKGVKEFLIQYGTVGNILEEVPEDAFVLQIGLLNGAGERYAPLFNVCGLKNLPRLIKKAFNKNNLEKKIKK